MIANKRIFFLTTIPGLESVAHLELCDKWARASDFFSLNPYPEVHITKGGLEFEAPLGFGLTLNQYLRVPNRMLLRETSFDAPDEASFVQGLKAIPWEKYFAKGSKFDFQFVSRSSKISMKNQVQRSLEKTLKPQGVKYKKGASTIYVRIFRDKCNISFDCTGELAFKRGQDKEVSIASLRESTASGCLRLLFQGVRGPFQLIDPMCGSGTFLTEALQVNQKLKRKFNYQSFPVFEKIKEEAEVGVLDIPPGHYPTPKKVIGYDIHEKAVNLAQKNGSFFKGDRYRVEQQDLFENGEILRCAQDDAFLGHPERSEGPLKTIVVLNPPWGKRLPASSQDLLKAVEEKFNPDRVGLLMPAQWRIQSQTMEKVRDIPLMNSGVENRFLVFAK